MFILVCVAILSYLDRGIVNILVPDLRRSLHLSEVEISLIQGFSFSLFFSVACLPLGAMVDRFNRRLIIIIGIAGWSVMTVACGLAENFWQLFVARAGVGIGEACLTPAAYSMISDLFPTEKRGRPMSVMLIAMALGAAASSIIGGALLSVIGNRGAINVQPWGAIDVWRLAFFWVGVPGLLFILLMLTVREPVRVATVRRKDQVGSYTRFLGEHWRTFLPLYVGIAFISVLSYATANWAPTAMMRIHGYSPGDAGVAVGATMIPSSILGAGFGGFLGDRLVTSSRPFGRLRAWLGGTLPALLGCICFAVDGPPWLFLLGLFLSVTTASAFGAISYPALFDALPGHFHGRAAGVCTLLGGLLGLGGGTAAVAVLTEHVFKGDNMVNFSMALVGGASAILSPLLILIQLRGYERLRTRLASSHGA